MPSEYSYFVNSLCCQMQTVKESGFLFIYFFPYCNLSWISDGCLANSFSQEAAQNKTTHVNTLKTDHAQCGQIKHKWMLINGCSSEDGEVVSQLEGCWCALQSEGCSWFDSQFCQLKSKWKPLNCSNCFSFGRCVWYKCLTVAIQWNFLLWGLVIWHYSSANSDFVK